MNQPTITAAVLTKNDEKNLPLCLERLEWVDDLVVVDSGSSDKTMEIAKQFKARIFVNSPQKFIHADQRNWVLDHARIRTDWVMNVDPDEIITEKLKEKILISIADAPLDVSAFLVCSKLMLQQTWLKHSVGYPLWHDKLYRFGQVRFKGGVWEKFDTNGKVGKIAEPFLHFPFRKGMGPWLEKHQCYAEFWAEQLMLKNNYSWADLIKALFFPHQEGKKTKTVQAFSVAVISISPFLRFFYHYFFKLGFLDGKGGFLFARMMAHYQFMIYLYFLEKKENVKCLRIKKPGSSLLSRKSQ